MSNFTDYDEFPVLFEMDLLDGFDSLETIITIVLQPIILALGFTVNIAFLFVVSRMSGPRATIDCFFVNLAVADTLFLIVAVSQKCARYFSTPFLKDDAFQGSAGCVLIRIATGCCLIASMIFITLVSWQRYLAVCEPQTYKIRQKLTCASHCQAAITWCAATVWAGTEAAGSSSLAIYSVPSNFTLSKPGYPRTIAFCVPANTTLMYIGSISQTVPFFIALFFNFTLYWRIIRRMRRQTRDMATRRGTKRRQNQVTVMLILTGATYFLCLGPFEINTIVMLVFTEGVPSQVMFIFRMLIYLNCAINPFIYVIANRIYRQAFKQVFSCQNCTAGDSRADLTKHLRKTPDNNINMR